MNFTNHVHNFGTLLTEETSIIRVIDSLILFAVELVYTEVVYLKTKYITPHAQKSNLILSNKAHFDSFLSTIA